MAMEDEGENFMDFQHDNVGSCNCNDDAVGCSQGHRSSHSLPLPTAGGGGAICLVCFTYLLRPPPLSRPPSLRLSHTISLLADAVAASHARRRCRVLVSPLVRALVSFHNCELVATQIMQLVSFLSAGGDADDGDDSLYEDFVVGMSDYLISNLWGRMHIYLVHCLGVILDCQSSNKNDFILADIKRTAALISSLINGLQFPSEEIHGEIFFVLYKLCILLRDKEEGYFSFDQKLLYLSLQALVKAQNDVVRTNCIALLTLLAEKGYLGYFFTHDPQINDQSGADTFDLNFPLEADMPLISLFADAIKGPLLSSDANVQICALDLIYNSLSLGSVLNKQIQVLVEESLADYVFELLRLSDNEDRLVISSIEVLHLLSNAGQAFRQSLSVGFPALMTVLHNMVEIPLHPAQCHTLKLALRCISDCPESISVSQMEELVSILYRLFRRDANGDIRMRDQTYAVACSTFIALLKLPTSHAIPKLAELGREILTNALLPSLFTPRKISDEVFLHSLYILKETYFCCHQSNVESSDHQDLAATVIEICVSYVLPWIKRVLDEVGEEEEIIMGVFEAFHSLLLLGYDPQTTKFAEILASSSWFTLSYGYMGLFASGKMKHRVYLMLSSIADGVLGPEAGQSIRDAAEILPSDPFDLLYLLGQKSSDDGDLVSCQAAAVLLLYLSSLHDQKIADEKQVLASLDQYILVNSADLLNDMAGFSTLTHLVHLYCFLRGSLEGNRSLHSEEAEKFVFHLMAKKEWTLFPVKILPKAVKWLFQQEDIIPRLSDHVLNFCRQISLKGPTNNWDRTDERCFRDLHLIADLVVVGDNCAAPLLVALLKQVRQDNQEDDATSLMNMVIEIVNKYPAGSDQFCLHGIVQAIQDLLSTKHPDNFFTTCLLLLFNILRSASPKMLLERCAWLSVTNKVLERFSHALTDDNCNPNHHLLLGVLSLILYHSSNQVLKEASTPITHCLPLISTVDFIIQAACAKDLTLTDYDEDTICSVLLMYYFCLRSSQVLDCVDFLLPSTEDQRVIFISCQDLCRLIYLGPSLVKLVASQCLLEQVTKISNQKKEPKCSSRCIGSLIAVLEGLIYYEDTRVAYNCASCLSQIMCWHKDNSWEGKWCRLVVEELVLSLVLPTFASKSFMNQHKPAAQIAVSLLKHKRLPKWMSSTFDGPCISSIIGNLSASNVSLEMVQLFKELVAQNFLNSEQVASITRIFQACRKQAYMVSSQEPETAEQFEQVLSLPNDTKKVMLVLLHLMLGTSANSGVMLTNPKRIVEEIELCFVESLEKYPESHSMQT